MLAVAGGALLLVGVAGASPAMIADGNPVVPNPVVPECGTNEFLNPCGSACEGTCTNAQPMCTKACLAPACQCTEGFVRNSFGACVDQMQCFIADGAPICVRCPTCPGCPGAPEPEPYDCRTREMWTDAKRAWCCENKNLGCPAPEPYDCRTRERWTDAKREWCCENKNLGCTPAPTRPVACCRALTPSCLACAAGQSVEDWCTVCRAQPNSARPAQCKGRRGKPFRQQCRQLVNSAAAREEDDDDVQTTGAFAGMVGAIAAVVSAAVAACVVVVRRRRSDAPQPDTTIDAAEEQLKDTADI